MRPFFSPDWPASANVSAIQSTRAGGASTGPYASLNLGVFGTDPAAAENLRQLTTAARLPHEPRFMQQTHGSTVIELDPSVLRANHGFARADACFTRTPGIVCAVLTADCLPILLSDTAGTVVAAIHAGWRGLHAGIIGKTIQAMNITDSQLHAWIGPGIGYANYVVDAGFRHHFVDQDPATAEAFYCAENGQWHADLKRIARHQLQQHGVRAITQTPLCTFDNKALFYSHRRDTARHGDTGRQASLIWINP